MASGHVANKSQGRGLNLDLEKLLEDCAPFPSDLGGASGLLQGYPALAWTWGAGRGTLVYVCVDIYIFLESSELHPCYFLLRPRKALPLNLS